MRNYLSDSAFERSLIDSEWIVGYLETRRWRVVGVKSPLHSLSAGEVDFQGKMEADK